MCFSPEADLVAGAVVGAIGVDALRRSRCRQELPLAALPLMLAGHQLVEAFVWWGRRGDLPAAMGDAAMWAYLLFAFAVLPVLVPWAGRAVEPDPGRRRRMTAFVVIGFGVSGVLLWSLLSGPVAAELADRHIAYAVHVPAGGWVVAGYVAVTCLSLMGSSHRFVRIFGAVNLGAAVVLAWSIPSGFTSLWCVCAALSSAVIARNLRTRQAGEELRTPRIRPAGA